MKNEGKGQGQTTFALQQKWSDPGFEATLVLRGGGVMRKLLVFGAALRPFMQHPLKGKLWLRERSL